MTREKAKRIMNKINNLERFLSNFERNNKEVSDGLSSSKKTYTVTYAEEANEIPYPSFLIGPRGLLLQIP